MVSQAAAKKKEFARVNENDVSNSEMMASSRKSASKLISTSSKASLLFTVVGVLNLYTFDNIFVGFELTNR